MRITLLSGFAMSLLMLATGCAETVIRGDQVKRSGDFYESLRFYTNGGQITISAKSRIDKLSIIGNDNTFVVEEGATLGKIEIWGQNNTVSIPDQLMVRESVIGEGSQIIRRSGEFDPSMQVPRFTP
jgi:hypothetical protein